MERPREILIMAFVMICSVALFWDLSIRIERVWHLDISQTTRKRQLQLFTAAPVESASWWARCKSKLLLGKKEQQKEEDLEESKAFGTKFDTVRRMHFANSKEKELVAQAIERFEDNNARKAKAEQVLFQDMLEKQRREEILRKQQEEAVIAKIRSHRDR